jgi:predicted AlkP superfamily pyrophosphatase or phosphodiesterase
MHRLPAGVAAGLALGLSVLAGTAACGLAQQPPAPAAPARPVATAATARPTLLVFLTVDQLRTDYLTSRFGAQLTGGLKRLRDGGALFVDAHHDHAISETAPGHASTMSGRFPMHTGIVRNAAGVQDSTAPLLAGGSTGPASPARFRGTVLYDWIRAAEPGSRALSLSRKDRGAILPLGRAKQQVYWWGGTSGFTTSTYYADTLPEWIRRVNARGFGARYAGRSWTPLLADSAYPEPDGVSTRWGMASGNFPHVVPEDTTDAMKALPAFPWMDDVTLEAALAGVGALQLGRGPATDVLAVSLSTTDAVGHGYGMESRELHDQVLRLDRALGTFLDSLFRLRDSTRVVIALTGDHGMSPVPQLHFARERARDAGFGYADVAPVLRAHNTGLAARGIAAAGQWDLESGALVVDTAAMRKARLRPDSALDALLRDLRRTPGVLYATPRRDLARIAAGSDTTAAKYARRWLHMLPTDLPVVGTVTLKPYWYWGGVTYATHGSPHDYDTNVPVLFWGRPFRAGSYREFARVVDMAPTLAAALGVTPTEPLDGTVLRQALR